MNLSILDMSHSFHLCWQFLQTFHCHLSKSIFSSFSSCIFGWSIPLHKGVNAVVETRGLTGLCFLSSLHTLPSSASSSHSDASAPIQCSATTVFLTHCESKWSAVFWTDPQVPRQALPPPPKGIVPPLKVNTVAVLNRPSFVLLSRIKCCAAPAAIREAFIIFLSVPASFFGRFRHVYGCPCQPAFLPCLHHWVTHSQSVWAHETEERKECFGRVVDMSDGIIGSCGNKGRGGVTGSVIRRVFEVPDTGTLARTWEVRGTVVVQDHVPSRFKKEGSVC